MEQNALVVEGTVTINSAGGVIKLVRNIPVSQARLRMIHRAHESSQASTSSGNPSPRRGPRGGSAQKGCVLYPVGAGARSLDEQGEMSEEHAT
jgi:hypothetical protein